MRPEEIDILTLIPQRPPFVLVDRLEDCQDRHATTQYTVREDNPLVNDGRLTVAGMMENIAQSCAALTGYVAITQGLAVKLGVIGAVRNMIINRQPMVGERIATTIYERDKVFGMTMVDAETRSGNELLASASMKIALIDNEA